MNKICVLTSARADYGILRPLIKRLFDNPNIDLSIVVTGMHLCPEFGYTYREIENDGFSIRKKVDIQISTDAQSGMSKTMGLALISFSDFFEELCPDMLVVLGDRYEIMAVSIAAYTLHIPIAHLHGGEITTGAIDDGFRHSITKMSSLHFTACEEYRKRVIQLGENPETVFNVGAMGVENVYDIDLLPLSDLEEFIGCQLQEKKYGVITFHPVTKEMQTSEKQLLELLDALKVFSDMQFIVTKSNSDAGGRNINKIWEEYSINTKNIHLVDSLGSRRYLSALKHAAMMIGNSSSGILEGPASKIPTINIGDRQKGRITADSVICCAPEKDAIIGAIKKALTAQFQELALDVVNPFGDGNTSLKIMEIMQEQLNNKKFKIKKDFYDVEFKF